MKTADIDMIDLAAALLCALLLFACQPPATGLDAVGGEGSAQPANPLAQWVPRVVAIEGTCDASLYLEVGSIPVRIRADAAAGHDHVGGEAGASVAIESALMSYACSYERGHRKECSQQPPVMVVLPEAPEDESEPEEAPEVDASEADPQADDNDMDEDAS